MSNISQTRVKNVPKEGENQFFQVNLGICQPYLFSALYVFVVMPN